MIFVLLCLQSAYQRTKQCTPKHTLFDLNESTYETLIGSSRSVFARMQNEGCPYSLSSQQYWQEAAELFPNIKFVRAECIYHNDLCKKLGVTISPSHSLFGPNSTTALDNFGNPADISKSSTYYVNIINEKLGFYPFDIATVEELIPQTTNKFFKKYEYPIFLLYDSSCDEDNDFIAQWLIDVTEEKISSESYGFGRLDCSLYSDECLKWGAKVPSASIFSRQKGISVSITEHDSISKRVKSVVAFLDKSTISYTEPSATEIPTQTPIPEIENVDQITIEKLQNREWKTIINKYNQAIQQSYSGNDYTESPDVYACNDVTLRSEAISDVVKLVNFYRELAGLPSNIVNDNTLNQGCYIAAKYSSRTNTLSHSVNEYFKKYCDFEANWELIKTRLAQSNLAQGSNKILSMISGLIDDEGENNEGVLGHRRWFLYPNLKSIGIGFYPRSLHNMGSYSLEYPASGVFSVTHEKYSSDEYNDLEFIAWPPPGPFPIDRLPSSWSVYYKSFADDSVNESNIEVRLTRDDGKYLQCSRIDLNKNLFGYPGTLIFKLNSEALQLITAGHSVHVQVYLLTDSERKVLDYSVDFYNPGGQNIICFYNNDKSKCPSIVEDSDKFSANKYNEFKPSSFDQPTIVYIAEEIKSDINFNFSKTIVVKGSKITGKITIGYESNVDINDPSSSEVFIDFDPTDFKCGVMKTAKKAKSITINFIKESKSKSRLRSLFYEGEFTDINFERKVTTNDYIYYYSLAYKNNEVYLVCTPINNAVYACYGWQERYDYYLDSSVKCIEFNEASELKEKLGKNKKPVKIYTAGGLTISYRTFPNNLVDYEVLSSNPITLEYSPQLESKVKSLHLNNYVENRNTYVKFSLSTCPYGETLLYNTKALRYVYPFKNLFISNFQNSNQYETPYVPDIVGDEAAKEALKYEENDVFDESKNEWADSNGAYNYPEKPENRNVPYNTLFITNGLHKEYSFSKELDDATVNIRIKPTESTASKPISLRFTASVTFQYVFVQDYKDVTITASKYHFSTIKLVNVSKARFIDSNNEKITKIVTDLMGDCDVDISSSAENPVSFEEIFFRTNQNVEGSNSDCIHATVVECSPTVKNMGLTNLYAVSCDLKLENCKLNSGVVEIYVKEQIVPTIQFIGNCEFNPTKISIIVIQESYSKSLLSLSDDLSFLFSGLDPAKIESLINKIVITDAFNSELSDYKIVLSKDKKALYIAKESFDESKAPESAPSFDDDQNNGSGDNDDDGTTFDENYELNPPAPSSTINDPNKGKGGLSTGAIIGIVIGVIAAVAIIIVVVILVLKFRKNSNDKNESSGEGNEKPNQDL